jgi:hypothetical protein
MKIIDKFFFQKVAETPPHFGNTGHMRPNKIQTGPGSLGAACPHPFKQPIARNCIDIPPSLNLFLVIHVSPKEPSRTCSTLKTPLYQLVRTPPIRTKLSSSTSLYQNHRSLWLRTFPVRTRRSCLSSYPYGQGEKEEKRR